MGQNTVLRVLSLPQAWLQLQNIAKDSKVFAESIPLADCLGRVLAQDIVSGADLPPFDRSAVDGFAVVSADTFGASAALPSMLLLLGEVKMGQRAGFAVSPGACAAVWTGGEVPQGADAMVMLEQTQRLAGDLIAIESPASPGAHVVFRGEDARAGACITPAGRRISPREIGALAALGYAQVSVARRPRVSILSTGDELVNPDCMPKEGQMRDVNGPMLQAASAAVGASARFLGIVPDDETALRSSLEQACQDCDLLLLSGASSAGEKDAAARCLSQLGEVAFHGLALKPGKPTFAGKIKETIVVGLPGHPAAAFLVFHALVRPLIAAISGEKAVQRRHKGTLAQTVPSNHGREELLPVQICEDGESIKPVLLKSGLISPLSRADGYIHIPRDAEGLSKGTSVEVVLF